MFPNSVWIAKMIKFSIILSLSVVVLLGTLNGPQLISRIYSNNSIYHLSKQLLFMQNPNSIDLTYIKAIETQLRYSTEWDSNNLTFWRVQGFLEWLQGNDNEAFNYWKYLNFQANDYIAYGTNWLIRHQNHEEALRWYKLAWILDPSNKLLWKFVGRLCQSQFKSGICDDFLYHNENNWIVDSTFVFDQAAWHVNQSKEITHSTGECPERPEHKCAHITTGKVPDLSKTWYQCLRLEPSQKYRFSSWIRVKASKNTVWRPVYYQGNINEIPKGSWIGDQYGSSEWLYWENVFIAPQFDDNWACFHPVRIGSNAEVWFYEAKLEIIAE